MNQRTKDKALKTLDRMAEIVRHDALAVGTYLSDEVNERRRKQGAPCGGHNVCLIGDLYVAHGVRVDEWGELRGVQVYERDEFMRTRPSLRAVFDALNAAAEQVYARRPELRRPGRFLSAAEDLFENNWHDQGKRYTGSAGRRRWQKRVDRGAVLRRGDILRLIASARRGVANA